MGGRQDGFSLVEIAIVLVIIGLLLGGILKGQEMINSARARHLSDLSTDIPAGYFGFIDRYNRVPGDWNANDAAIALGVSVTGGGNDNGSIDNPGPGTTLWQEPNALWEQLSKAGFIEGAYAGDDAVPTNSSGHTPLNAFNSVVIMGRTPDYQDSGTPPVRLNLVLGRGIPVDIAQETDIKLDDGLPLTGVLRLAIEEPGNVFGLSGSTVPGCITAGENTYNVAGDQQDCNLVYVY